MIIQLLASYGGGSGTPTPTPILDTIESQPILAVFNLLGYGTGDFIIQASQSPIFETVSHERIGNATTTVSFEDIPLVGQWYFRGKKNTPSSIFSAITSIVFTQTVLRTLTISANAGIGEITIEHNCTNSEPNFSHVSVRRGLSALSLVEIDTFAPSTADYIDATVVNGVTYFYELKPIRINDNFIDGSSNIVSATPEAVTPTLSTPTGLIFTQIDNTSGTLSWNAVSNATAYTPRLDTVPYTSQAGLSKVITGLTVGQVIDLSVFATAAGYIQSPTATITRTVIDTSTATEFTLEEYGGQGYYKPLDGSYRYTHARKRRYDETNAEYKTYLLTLTPDRICPTVTISGHSADGTVPVGQTKVVSSLANTFTASDVGKRIALLHCHLMPPTANPLFIDDYYPNKIATKYATVVSLVNATTILVDTDINGGSITSPQIVAGGQAYIFTDNTEAFEDFRVAFASDTRTVLNLRAWALEANFVEVCYVIPEYKSFTLLRDLEIKNIDNLLPMLKVGFEDYYQHELYAGVPQRWQGDGNAQVRTWFAHNSSTTRNFTINAILVPPHRTFYEASTLVRGLVTGSRGGGLTTIASTMSLTELHFLNAAGKFNNVDTNHLTFRLLMERGGTLEDVGLNDNRGVSAYATTLIKHVESRAFDISTQNSFPGGATRLVWEDVRLENNEVLTLYSEFDSIAVEGATAYDGFSAGIVSRKDSFIPYVFEARAANLFEQFLLGGSARTTLWSIEGTNGVYTFNCNVQGIRGDNPGEFCGYWEYFYRGARDAYKYGWTSTANPFEPMRTASKIAIYEQIPEVGETYTIGREYKGNEVWDDLIKSTNSMLNNTDTDGANAVLLYPNQLSEGAMLANTVRTAIAWTTVYQDWGSNFINSDPRIPTNGKPLALQPGDRGTIPHYIHINKQVISLAENAAIVGSVSGATANVSSLYSRWENRKLASATPTSDQIQGHKLAARIDAAGNLMLSFANKGSYVNGSTTVNYLNHTTAIECEISSDGISWSSAPSFSPPSGGSGLSKWNQSYTIAGYTDKTATYYVRYRVIGGGEYLGITKTTSEWIGFSIDWRNLVWLKNVVGTFTISDLIGGKAITGVSTHDVAEVYTVMLKDWKGNSLDTNPAEITAAKSYLDTFEPKYGTFTNLQSYRYAWCSFDKNLPSDIGITFEFKITTSVSQELLTNKIYRRTMLSYLSLNGVQGYGFPNSFIGSSPTPNGYPIGITLDAQKLRFSTSEPAFKKPPLLNHDLYTQIECTEHFKRVGASSTFWRQNSNNQTGLSAFNVTYDGLTISTNCRGAYSQGKTLIDCVNFPQGEYGADDGVRHPAAKRFAQIDHIRKANGVFLEEELKPKLRFFNVTPSVVSTITGKQTASAVAGLVPLNYVENNLSSAGAPDMPAECRAKLISLGITD